MITTDKVTEIFCILDEFCKNLDAELTKNLHIAPIDEGYKRMRNRKGQMSKSEIMTILLCYHFGSFRKYRAFYYIIQGCTSVFSLSLLDLVFLLLFISHRFEVPLMQIAEHVVQFGLKLDKMQRKKLASAKALASYTICYCICCLTNNAAF